MRTTIGDLRLMIIAELADVIDIGRRRKRVIMVIEDDMAVIHVIEGDAETTASSRPGYADYRSNVERYLWAVDWETAPIGTQNQFNQEAYEEWIDEIVGTYHVTHVIITEPGNPGTIQIPIDEWRKMGYPTSPDETPDEMWPEGKGANFCSHCAVKVGGDSEEQTEEEREETRKWNENWERLLADADKAMRRWAMIHPDFEYIKDAIVYPKATRPGVKHRDTGMVVIQSLLVAPYGTEPGRERDIIEVKWDLRPKGSHRRHVKEKYVSPESLRTLDPPANLESTLDMP